EILLNALAIDICLFSKIYFLYLNMFLTSIHISSILIHKSQETTLVHQNYKWIKEGIADQIFYTGIFLHEGDITWRRILYQGLFSCIE
ncbi:hypothetical protein ACJX0J_026299, partial [Zea mays]